MIVSGDILPEKKYSRIISLVPSLTELLFDLGLEEEVIGITKFCVHPEKWFRTKTRIGGTKDIHFEKIHELAPDLIIANKEENIKEQIEELAKNYDVLITDINDLQEAEDAIKTIGLFTQKSEQAVLLAENIRKRFQELKEVASTYPTKKVAYFIWKNPYMVAANETFINSLLKYCAFENIFLDKSRYPSIEIDEIQQRNCDLILLSSEPYPFKEKHQLEIESLLPQIKVALVDGEMFSWYGSRLLKSVNYFSDLITSLHTPN